MASTIGVTCTVPPAGPGSANISLEEITKRIFIAAGLGLVVGMQREIDNHPAGLRTHMVVTMASCIVMLVSQYGFYDNPGYSGDAARIAAQAVNGIGFMGAGVIVQNGVKIKGLTSAATLWTCAAMGLAVGTNFWYPAVITCGLVVVVLSFFKKLQGFFMPNPVEHITLRGIDYESVQEILLLLDKENVPIISYFVAPDDRGDDRYRDITIRFELSKNEDLERILSQVALRHKPLLERIFNDFGSAFALNSREILAQERYDVNNVPQNVPFKGPVIPRSVVTHEPTPAAGVQAQQAVPSPAGPATGGASSSYDESS